MSDTVRAGAYESHSIVEPKPYVAHKADTTASSYVNIMRHLFAFLLFEAPDGKWAGYKKAPSTPKLTRALNAFKAAIKVPNTSDKAREDVYTAIDDVLEALWHHSWGATLDDPFKDPTQCFLAIHHLRESGSFDEAKQVPWVLTRLVSFHRGYVLRMCHLGDPLKMEQTLVRLHYFIEQGRGTPFSTLWRLQAYAQAISKSSLSKPRIWFSDRTFFHKLVYKGHNFTVEGMVKWVDRLEIDIISGIEWLGATRSLCLAFNSGATEDLRDNVDSKDFGYVWFTDPANVCVTRAQDELFLELLENRALFTPDGKMIAAGWQKWLQKLAWVERRLMQYIQLTEGSPSRATELVALLAANGVLRGRNGVLMPPHYVFVSQYTKSTAVTGFDKHIPKAVSAFTSWALFQVHGLFRRFARMATPIVFADRSNEVQSLYLTMMFMNYGQMFTSAQLSADMEVDSAKIFTTGFKINAMRHICTALCQEFIPANRNDFTESHYRFAATIGFGHSQETSDSVYGLVEGTLGRHSHHASQGLIEVSQLWQKAFGVVPSGTPVLDGHDARVAPYAEPVAVTKPPTASELYTILDTKISGLGDLIKQAGLSLEQVSTVERKLDTIVHHYSRFGTADTTGSYSPALSAKLDRILASVTSTVAIEHHAATTERLDNVTTLLTDILRKQDAAELREQVMQADITQIKAMLLRTNAMVVDEGAHIYAFVFTSLTFL